jgi:hypothetical protein
LPFRSTQGMAEFLTHLIQFSLWVFFVIFAFAIIGVWATIHWIVRQVTRAEDAVHTGVQRADDAIHRR